MGKCFTKCLFAPVLDEFKLENNRLQANVESLIRQHQNNMEQIFNSILTRLHNPTFVTNRDDGQRVNNDVRYQKIVDVFDSLATKQSADPLRLLEIDFLNMLIRTYVIESKLASREMEFREIVNILTSNSVSAEKFAWLESQVEVMAACCLHPECVKDLMNEWQRMRAIHQQRVELEISLGSASTSAYSTVSSNAPPVPPLRSKTHNPTSAYFTVSSNAPPVPPMRSKTHDPTTSVKQVNIEQHENANGELLDSKYMNAETASNYDAIANLTKQLTQSVRKIITTMLHNAKYEYVIVDVEPTVSGEADYESVNNDFVDVAGIGIQPPLRNRPEENESPDAEVNYEVLSNIPNGHNYSTFPGSSSKNHAELVALVPNLSDNNYIYSEIL